MGNNFTSKAENALNKSVSVAEELGHTYIGSEHILLALLQDETSCAYFILKKYKVTEHKVFGAIKEYSGIGASSKLTSKDTTPKCRKILENSYKCAKKYSSSKIGTEHILLAIIEERECVASKILAKIEAETISIKDDIINFLRSCERGVLFAEPVVESSIPTLAKYGKNITKLAEEGRLDPIIGREKETDRVIRILSRRSKNNPCLIGEAGVGKTAIVEGLAKRIFDGNVPSSLLGKIIYSLDLTSIVAGAKYRGDFEERIKNIMQEVGKNKSIILFIDEIHTIVGAGAAEGAIDAANIMKPELSRGDIQLIGATTLAEYRKYIEKDGALERRFQPVIIEEPSLEATINILNGIKDRYENHHNVIIEQSAIDASVKLSKRYIQDRFLPDKAIDLLDEACAMASVTKNFDSENLKIIREKIRQISIDKKNAVNNQDFELAMSLKELEQIYSAELAEETMSLSESNKKTVVTERDVMVILSEITGINLDTEYTRERLNIFEKLSCRVIGQEAAVQLLSEAVIRSYAGINYPDKPRGIFLFLGESGVGKTELAKALANELFNSEDSLIRYDMSEFSESYSISKFIGSAPGYVGYDEQNSALEQIRKRPYSVVLLDEIEKAHPDVLSLLLQVFDNGYLTDATGRKISFKNAYIIMTSNIGESNLSGSKSLGFMKNSSRNSIHERLKGNFKDELINRIDEIILFESLNHSALKQIAKIKLLDISARLQENGYLIKIEEKVYDFIAEEAKQKGFGARPINRIITTKIENVLAKMIVSGEISRDDEIIITLLNDEINCVKACASIPATTLT